MAEAVAAGEFDVSAVGSVDAIAFGCPSMGAEELGKANFFRSSLPAKRNFRAKRSHSSALTVGETENG